jgi:hypothetical protein
MCPVYSVNDLTGLYLTPTLSQWEREIGMLFPFAFTLKGKH